MVSRPGPPALPAHAPSRKGSAPKDLVPRLARIEGQVRGVARMVEEGRWCPDILVQLSAVEAALARVKERLLESHLTHCVTRILESGEASEKRAAVAEVVDALRRAR
ncbi:metal-sensitive transcriptional regulator [Acidobacteria bacterium ACD]|nr:MAG: transcriptional regulator [Acidobacteriota bacterium]MDL1951478.1 metal-sensitive transcriptional regulator [Acidobacteria bacterium ACD]